jgi:hypothetical protein
VTFNHVTAHSGSGSPFDIGFQGVNGFCVTSSANTTGGMLRINATGSTAAC